MTQLNRENVKLRHVCKVLASCRTADQLTFAMNWAVRAAQAGTITFEELDCAYVVNRAVRDKLLVREVK